MGGRGAQWTTEQFMKDIEFRTIKVVTDVSFDGDDISVEYEQVLQRVYKITSKNITFIGVVSN